MNTPPLSVLHVLPGLGFGGTEFVVLRLAQAERDRGVQSELLSLKGGGPLIREVESSRIPYRCLTLSGGLGALHRWKFPVRKNNRPFDVVHGWLYSGNLVAGVFSRGWPGSGLIWNLMQANVTPAVNGFKTRLLMQGGGRMSQKWPDRIVCNSLAAQEAHQGLGFAISKMQIIPNGIDTGMYRPFPEARAIFCKKQGVSPTGLMLGHLARWDPHKDHRTLVRSVGMLLKKGIDAHLFLGGPGVDKKNSTLMNWIGETGFSDRFHPIGVLETPHLFLSSLDIFCLSSVGESSSYALAEAMACGVPAVVTDVGDSRQVLGVSGIVVPPSDPEAFCQGLYRLATLDSPERTQLGLLGRDRIMNHYSFKKMVDAYQALYQDVLSHRGSQMK